MSILRRRVWVAVLFMLISMGQGFALSYVLHLPDMHSIRAEGPSSPVPAHLLICGHDFRDGLRENPLPNQKHPEEILSLRSDPFMPSLHRLPRPILGSSPLLFIYYPFRGEEGSPPERPPRSGLPTFLS